LYRPALRQQGLRRCKALRPVELHAGGSARGLGPWALSRMPVHISSPEMARSAASANKEPASYEQALAELDRLVAQMEGGQLPLDQLLDGYRRGAELLAYCRGRLQAVEEQVKVLDDGQLKVWSAE
jgi:exodeoxyribonuclease VII small subunit